MRKLFAIVLIGGMALILASPTLAEHPAPFLYETGTIYLPKSPPQAGPEIPEPPLRGIGIFKRKQPIGTPTVPTKVGGQFEPTKGTMGELGFGGAAILGPGRGGGAVASSMQETRRGLKKLIRDLG